MSTEQKKMKNKKIVPILVIIAVLFIFWAIGDNKNKNNTQSAVSKEDEAAKKQNDSIAKVRLAELEIEINKMKPLFTTRYDDIEGITWINHKNEPKYASTKSFYIYLGTKMNGDVWQRLVIRYYGDSWLFIKKITVKSDERVFEMIPGTVERDHNSDVWEWIDISVSEENTVMIRSIIAAKTTKVRFTGNQYYSDWTLTSKEVKGLKDTQQYFDLLKEKAELEKSL